MTEDDVRRIVREELPSVGGESLSLARPDQRTIVDLLTQHVKERDLIIVQPATVPPSPSRPSARWLSPRWLQPALARLRALRDRLPWPRRHS
jgi:hypothetical protein